MDRYLYLGTLYYLTRVYLRRIDALFIFFFCIFLIQNTNTLIKFLAPLPGTNVSLVMLPTTYKYAYQVLCAVVGEIAVF